MRSEAGSTHNCAVTCWVCKGAGCRSIFAGVGMLGNIAVDACTRHHPRKLIQQAFGHNPIYGHAVPTAEEFGHMIG